MQSLCENRGISHMCTRDSVTNTQPRLIDSYVVGWERQVLIVNKYDTSGSFINYVISFSGHNM